MTTQVKTTAQDRALNFFAEMMIKKIETVSQDWSKPWFTGTAAWPRNFDGRLYNGGNALLLSLVCEAKNYKYPTFVTFDKVMKYNADKTQPRVSVNKGESSTPVMIYTTVYFYEKKKITYKQYQALTEEQKADVKSWPSMQVYNVFNIAQTNIEQARPELFTKLTQFVGDIDTEHGDNWHHEQVDNMLANNTWLCPIHIVAQDRAFYRPSTDEITVPTYEQFKDGESFYGTLFHEMGHSTGHKSRLDRNIENSFGNNDYAREELVAELTAALTAQYFGMVKHIDDNSAAYMKSWLKALKQDANYIKTVITDVRKASAMITKAIEA